MTTPSTESSCPKCGNPIPEEAPQGLCPKCVLVGAATVTDSATPTMISGGGRVAPPTIEEIAPHFPEFEIIELIGAGGMGAVYKVRQTKLDRMVALKILTKDLANDPAFVERFNREARVLAKLNHPNIVTVYDFGTAGPFCFLVMEFVDGVNLRQAMRDGGGFTPADSLALVGDLCEALGFAHDEGIMHRDIKPENILIDSRGRVMIADFGIAKLVGESAASDLTLTIQGSVLGSPQYMAPEQIETPGDVDQRADIYSIGVVFYELLTGELPLGRFALPSEKAQMDARIDEIVLRTLEKEREARFQSAGEIETSIEALSQAPGSLGQQAAGAAAPAPAVGKQATDNQRAKFALASAILTGTALLMAVVSVFIYLYLVETSRYNRAPRLVELMGGALLTLLPVVPALLGFLFGSRALGEIHRSNGHKLGLGSAMFGALAIPVLLILAVSVLMAVFAMKATNLDTIGLISAALVIIGCIAAAWYLIRTVRAWALGDSAPCGKITGTRIGWSAAVAVCAALLAFVVIKTRPFGERDPGGEAMPVVTVPGSNEPKASSDAGVAEALPAPAAIAELEMAFTAPAGKVSVFALQAPWDKDHESPDDWYVVAPDDADLKGRITFTMTDAFSTGRGPLNRVEAKLLDEGGKLFATHRFYAPKNHTMSLPPTYPVFEMDKLPDGEITGPGGPMADPESIDLKRAGLHMVVFGHQQDCDTIDSLRMLAWSTPKPDGADVKDWMTQQVSWLNKKKGNPESVGENAFRISQMEGEIRARAGFLFDTRERILKPKRTGLPRLPSALNEGKNFVVDTLRGGESLILPKGSEAKLESGSGGEFQIGPQAGAAQLVLDSERLWILPFYDSALTLEVEKVPGGEFTLLIPASSSSLIIREPAAFHLGSGGKLQVLEGEVTVSSGPKGEEEKTLTAGQVFTLPKPPVPQALTE